MIVDAHAHLGNFYASYPLRITTTEGVIQLMDRFKIDMACVSSLEAVQFNFFEGNRNLRREIEKFLDRFIPLCTVNPRFGEAAILELRKCVQEWRFKGLNLHPTSGYQPYPADCLSAQETLSEASKLRIPVLIHSSQHDMAHPSRIGKLADTFPDVTIIMGNMGYMTAWQDAIEAAKKYENIILDTTSAQMCISLVKRAVEVVSPERVVFGTNMPMDYPGPNIVRITWAEISEEAKRKIMGENILRILRIKY